MSCGMGPLKRAIVEFVIASLPEVHPWTQKLNLLSLISLISYRGFHVLSSYNANMYMYIYIYICMCIYIYIEMHIHLWIYMRCICLFSVFECVLIPFWCPVISFQGTGALPTARRPAAHGESSCHFQNRFVKLVTVLVMVLVPVLNNSGYC